MNKFSFDNLTKHNFYNLTKHNFYNLTKHNFDKLVIMSYTYKALPQLLNDPLLHSEALLKVFVINKKLRNIEPRHREELKQLCEDLKMYKISMIKTFNERITNGLFNKGIETLDRSSLMITRGVCQDVFDVRLLDELIEKIINRDKVLRKLEIDKLKAKLLVLEEGGHVMEFEEDVDFFGKGRKREEIDSGNPSDNKKLAGRGGLYFHNGKWIPNMDDKDETIKFEEMTITTNKLPKRECTKGKTYEKDDIDSDSDYDNTPHEVFGFAYNVSK
jgi:hypothetical protein